MPSLQARTRRVARTGPTDGPTSQYNDHLSGMDLRDYLSRIAGATIASKISLYVLLDNSGELCFLADVAKKNDDLLHRCLLIS
jgi:hypothetical protein